ncbi:protein-tyrosine phosphatase family protein [Rhodopirellula sp. JC639]|uniref:protein-tyrosine phosphatase family protein n=1 Tax=Stieleria mannarensis TaxID=2755585 RepID=UPI001601DA87|nr:dual specificity protein phosphatase family protein [Rhodopirellula sp. JC639]
MSLSLHRPAKPPVARTYWVIESRFLAGAYPGAADPPGHRHRVEQLWKLGIRTFINLIEEDESNHYGQPFLAYDGLLREFASPAGDFATHLRFPIEDLGVPSSDRMACILDAIDLSLAADRPVYVHCFGGVGRTGIVVGCWLIRHGFVQPADAIEVLATLRQADEVTRHRPAPENGRQCRFVENWTRSAT